MKAGVVLCFVILLVTVIVNAKHRDDSIFADEVMSTDSRCHSCLEASRKAEVTLKDPKLFEKVDMLSSEVCHILPTNLEAKCLETSSAHVHRARTLLQEFFHENNICGNTALCLDDFRFPINNGLDTGKNFLDEIEDQNDCIACRRAVKDIKMRLKQSKIRTKITEVLIEYCEEADANEEHCKQAVYKYVPAVLSKLDKMKPAALCLMMGMCGEEISM